MSPSEHLKRLGEGKSGKAVPCPQAVVMRLGELCHGARSLGVRVTDRMWEGSAEGRCLVAAKDWNLCLYFHWTWWCFLCLSFPKITRLGHTVPMVD